MGRLAGFRYREIVKRLKTFGFKFDRQAAMKFGLILKRDVIQLFLIIRATCPKVPYAPF
jgi:hypothetical protein